MLFANMMMARISRVAELCEREWLLLAMLVVVPVAQVPTFTEASFLAVAFFVAMLFVTAVLLYEAASHPYACPEYAEYDATSALLGFSEITFAYSGLAIFPEMIAEMREPREFSGATGSLALAYYVIAPLYTLSGIVPFWAWGTETQPNVLYNFSRGRLADVVLGAQVVMELTGQLQNHLLIAGKIERALGAAPSGFWAAPPKPGGNGDSPLSAWPPVLARALVRCSIITVELFLAALLLLSGVGDIQALAGAVSIIPLSFVVPIVSHLALYPNDYGPLARRALQAMVALGVIITVGAVWASFVTIAANVSSYRIFANTCDAEFGFTPSTSCLSRR